MANAELNQPMVAPRDNWWHVVAALPVLLILILLSAAVGISSSFFHLMQLLFALLYLPAIVWDARYVRLLGTDWQPGKWLYGFCGLLVLLTLGLFSFIVSPYYLYKRRKHTGAP